MPSTTTKNNTFNWFSSYEKLPRIPLKTVEKIRKLCGARYIDLLLHLPIGLQHRLYRERIADCAQGEMSVLSLQVVRHINPNNRRQPLRIQACDAEGDLIDLVFFSYGSWVNKAYAEGSKIAVCGDVTPLLTTAQIVHPELLPKGQKLGEFCGYFPQYPLTAGVGQKTMQNVMRYMLHLLEKNPLGEWLEDIFKTSQKFPTFEDALRAVHQPKDMTVMHPNGPERERLAFDELLAWQMSLFQARQHTKNQTGIPHPENGPMRRDFLKLLPFRMTNDQKQALADIDADMTSSAPMLRLVQGDVGSGKTVVGFAALARTVEAGFQGAMMAPTEILALQHFNNAQKWLEPLGIRIETLTGKRTAKQKREIKQRLIDGEIDVIFGTHALIEDTVQFANLGLVVVDEQHRFGVKQRLALSKDNNPDILVMTATPIPRTLAITFYGDMDITLIREKPPGRTPIETKVLSTDRLADMASSLRHVLEIGEQVYWVCPLVEESEKSDLAAATERHETLQQFYGDAVGLLHGKLKPKEKEKILNDFKEGVYRILVSTTVIEVGVDVPNATVMVIEHAERFGLAQLHQLRGRVGRGSLKSTCVLLYAGKLSPVSRERLNMMRESEDGFLLAEKDLELRGPGETLGTAQSGRVFTKIASLGDHKHLMPLAKDYAEKFPMTDHKKRFLFKVFGRDSAIQLLKA